MNKKILGIVVLICVVSAFVVGVYASKNVNFFQWGEEIARINEKTSTDVVAKVNGVDIPRSKFDSYKAGLANANGSFSDEEILNKLIEQEVIMQEIVRLGYTVTESEVTKFNDERFALLEEDSNAYQIVKDYVDGLGITMEEYKEMSKEVSRTALLANKYKADVMSEYVNNTAGATTFSAQQRAERFEEYFNNKIETLSNAATIEIIE